MKLLKLLIILLITPPIFSQASHQTLPFIEVTGTAETEIVPDEIYIDLSLKERMEGSKKLTISFLENQLKNELKIIGVSEQNLFISDVNTVLSKTGWWKEEILSVANYTLKIKGANTIKLLFEKFKKLKIDDVRIAKATHSNIIELRKKNRIKAIKIAKAKADYLLAAIGEKTGKPIIINEITANNPPNYINPVFANSRSPLFKSSEYETKVVQFKKIKTSSSIYVKFQIK